MTVAWTLVDMSGVMPSYSFITNPNTMTSPLMPKTLEGHGSTVDGGIRAFGKRPPHDWTFGGVLYSEQEYNTLRDYVAKAGLVMLTDHLGRTFHVRLKSFTATRAWTRKRPWRHKYTVNATTYGGPL